MQHFKMLIGNGGTLIIPLVSSAYRMQKKENFYWIQMYKLASATRGDRALIDNTGPWLSETPWPNAWWNLNVQLTYWALNASDHLDLAASLENALYNHIDQLRLNIPAAYRHNSLGIGVASNLECMTTTVGIPGKGKAQVGLLPWACHNLLAYLSS